MQSGRISLTLVVQRPPCGACQVIEQLTRESLEKVAGADPRITVELHEVRHPTELRRVAGLEVEKLPAVLINGEQVTAGRIVTTRDVKEYLNELDL
ncbi:MAG: thioredoxin family protein [Spirochaetota bacterium]